MKVDFMKKIITFVFVLFVTTQTVNIDIKLSCDEYGNLS